MTQILTKGTMAKGDDDLTYLPNYLISMRVFGEMFAFSLLEMGTNEIIMGIAEDL